MLFYHRFEGKRGYLIWKKKLEQAYLYDFYGELLNEHQRQVYEDFVFNDLSLGEIASEEGFPVRVLQI